MKVRNVSRMERDTFTEFNNTTNTLIDELTRLSEIELNTRITDGSWSPGQIADHLLKSYAFVEILKGGTKPSTRPPDEKIEPIRTIFLDFNIKMKAPKAIFPTNLKISKEDLISKIKIRIEEINAIIQNKDLTEICIDFVIPEYGEFTRLEWIWFNIYHTQRHIHQLKIYLAKL